MTKKILLISLFAVLALAALIPIKSYERSGCLVGDADKRLNLVLGENIGKLDDMLNAYQPGINEGMCDPTPQTFKLYLL